MSDMNGQSTDPGPQGVHAVSGIPATGAATSGIACCGRLARSGGTARPTTAATAVVLGIGHDVVAPLITMAFLWFSPVVPEVALHNHRKYHTALCTSAMLTLGRTHRYRRTRKRDMQLPVSARVHIALATRV